MLRYLDPGAMLDEMRGDEPVQSVPLKVARGDEIEAWLARGRVDSFPVFRERQQSDEPVALSLWIDKATHRLRALRIDPLDEKGKPVPGQGEYVTIHGFAEKKGVLLPLELRFFVLDGAGGKTPKVEVTLLQIELNPDLDRGDFERPK